MAATITVIGRMGSRTMATSRTPKPPCHRGGSDDGAEASSMPVSQPRWRRWLLVLMAGLTGMGGVLALAGLALSLDLLSLRVWVAYHLLFLAQPVAWAGAPLSKPIAQALEEGLSLLGIGLIATGLIVAMLLLARHRPRSRWLQSARAGGRCVRGQGVWSRAHRERVATTRSATGDDGRGGAPSAVVEPDHPTIALGAMPMWMRCARRQALSWPAAGRLPGECKTAFQNRSR